MITHSLIFMIFGYQDATCNNCNPELLCSIMQKLVRAAMRCVNNESTIRRGFPFFSILLSIAVCCSDCSAITCFRVLLFVLLCCRKNIPQVIESWRQPEGRRNDRPLLIWINCCKCGEGWKCCGWWRRWWWSNDTQKNVKKNISFTYLWPLNIAL